MEDGTTEQLKAKPWRELKQNTWYKVEEVTSINTIKGPAKILTLKDRNKTVTRVWATSVIKLNIDGKMAERGDDCFLFIKSKGLKKCKNNSGNSFYDHQYVLKK